MSQRSFGFGAIAVVAILAVNSLAPGVAGAQTLKQQQYGPVTLYQLPDPKRQPYGITVDHKGQVWVTLGTSAGVLVPGTGEYREVPSPEGLGLYSARTAPDGAVWFTDFILKPDPGQGHLIKVHPESQKFTVFPLPTNNAGPSAVRFGKDGSVWVSEFLSAKIGKLQSNGVVQEYPLVKDGEMTTGPFGVELDEAGDVWVAENYQDRIARLNPATGKVTRYPLPEGFDGPNDLMKDKQGRLWVSAHAANRVAYLEPGTGKMEEFYTQPPDPGMALLTLPFGLEEGDDGHIWFAEHEGNRIGRLIPEGRTVVEYPLPQPDTWAQWITKDRQGNIWYAGYNTHSVGRIDRDAPYVTFDLPERQIELRPGETYNGTMAVRAVGGHVALDLSVLFPEEEEPGSGPRAASRRLNVTFSPARIELAPGEEKRVHFAVISAPTDEAGERKLQLAGRSQHVLASTVLKATVLPPAWFSAGWFRVNLVPVLVGGFFVLLLLVAGWVWVRQRNARVT